MTKRIILIILLRADYLYVICLLLFFPFYYTIKLLEILSRPLLLLLTLPILLSNEINLGIL